MFNKNVFTQKDPIADLIKGINEADYKAKMEALKGNQHKLDKNKNNKVDADDFKILRGEKKVNEDQGVAEGLGKDIKRLATGKDVKSRAGQEIAKSQDASMKGDTKTSKKHFDRYDKLDKLANKEQVEEATSVKIPTSTGTRVLGHRYGNAAKTHRDSMADPFAVVKGPGQKDIEDLEKKKVKKEEIDPKKVTTDTLAGVVKGKTANPFAPKKVMIDVAGNVNEEELDEASFDPLKHVKNPSPAVKAAAKDVKRGSYADRAALMKAGGVKDDRGPRGVTQEEVEELDERELSKGETAEKERIVKGMKKSLAGFKARYGDKAKSVMYATATKQAKKD